MNGTIARIIGDKGFGFVRNESGTEYFFHRSAVRDTTFELLQEGDRVTFEQGSSDKGPRAEEVRKA